MIDDVMGRNFMFREMRRSRQALSEAECIEILDRNTAGVLGVNGDDGYPYTVPVSYIYKDGKIFFHGARIGHKIESILRSDKVSFCVIDQDKVVPEELTTYFRSVICFGRARLLEDEDEIRSCARLIGTKYSKGYEAKSEASLARKIHVLGCVEITIEHMTGKQAIEMVPQKTEEDLH